MPSSQNAVSDALSGNAIPVGVNPVDEASLGLGLENTVSGVASDNTVNVDASSVARRGPLGILAGLTVCISLSLSKSSSCIGLTSDAKTTLSNVASGNTVNVEASHIVRRGPLGILADVTVFLPHFPNPLCIANLCLKTTLSNIVSGNTVNVEASHIVRRGPLGILADVTVLLPNSSHPLPPANLCPKTTLSNIVSGNTLNVDTSSVARREPLGILADVTVFLPHSVNPLRIANLCSKTTVSDVLSGNTVNVDASNVVRS